MKFIGAIARRLGSYGSTLLGGAILAIAVAVWAASANVQEIAGTWKVTDLNGQVYGLELNKTVVINAAGSMVGENNFFTALIWKRPFSSHSYLMVPSWMSMPISVKSEVHGNSLLFQFTPSDMFRLQKIK